MYDQNDIILVPFPYSDLTSFKSRPALIVSNSKFNKSEDRICCLITSSEPEKGILISNKDVNKKLPFKSWVKPYRIFTVSKKIIKKKISTVSSKFYKDVLDDLYSYL